MSLPLSLGPIIFVDLALMVAVLALVSCCGLLGMLDELVRPLGSDVLKEVSSWKLEGVIDEALKLLDIADRQVTLEDHPIKTGKTALKETGILREEGAYCKHGIHSWVLLCKTILTCRMPFSHHFPGWWAKPALRGC